jgi:hypothetical protein
MTDPNWTRAWQARTRVIEPRGRPDHRHAHRSRHPGVHLVYCADHSSFERPRVFLLMIGRCAHAVRLPQCHVRPRASGDEEAAFRKNKVGQVHMTKAVCVGCELTERGSAGTRRIRNMEPTCCTIIRAQAARKSFRNMRTRLLAIAFKGGGGGFQKCQPLAQVPPRPSNPEL